MVMDVTLRDYEWLSVNRAYSRVANLMSIVKNFGGVLTVLWHNSNMLYGWGNLYERLLKLFKDEGAWCTSCSRLIDWWERVNE